jgi:hypothetical protein
MKLIVALEPLFLVGRIKTRCWRTEPPSLLPALLLCLFAHSTLYWSKGFKG